MDIKQLNYYYNKFKFGEDNFHNLMKSKVREVLLISTFYDAFIFEQDGRFSEQIFGEYRQLNLSTAPRITSVPTGEEALNKLSEKKYDLVITMMRIGEISPFELSKKVKEKYSNIPILLLLNVESDIVLINQNREKMKFIDDVFLWKGDSKLFLAMIKYVEDKRNLEYDTKHGLVRVILLIEDSVRYYSRFLPLLYEEILKQTQRLISEELNDINKRLRMRVRPKVILVHNYDEAEEILNNYREYIISIISDVKYIRKGEIDSQAGIKLLNKIKNEKFDIPVLLQSSDLENKLKAEKLNVAFLHKNSTTLLKDLRKFILNNLGFGDFIIRNQDGEEISRATSLLEFEKMLPNLSIDSLLYHGKKNHFSAWLIAHGEIQVAKKIKPIKNEDFSTSKAMRRYLIAIFKQVRLQKNRGKVTDFSEKNIDSNGQIVKLSEGSLGGKGRGLAFLNALFVAMELEKQFSHVDIAIPSTAIIGTNEFDLFVENNDIYRFIEHKTDQEINDYFLKCKLTDGLMKKLKIFLQYNKKPLAIRSSGLLEDSQSQPFAGIYKTYMLPNNHPNELEKLNQTAETIKLVYASVFLSNARNYLENINYEIEEEKMAVILQEVVGIQQEKMYYPHISGVAQSYNYYPTANLENKDGIAMIALGLGKTVVEGEKRFVFCPHYPKTEIISINEVIRNTQKEFYAINMEYSETEDLRKGKSTLQKNKIKNIKHHKNFNHLVSIWDYENNTLSHDVTRKGPVIVNFANVIKYNYFPLAKIITQILEIGEIALGVPVEIEFAVNIDRGKENVNPIFSLLQIRPLTVNLESISIDKNNLDKSELLLYTEKGMGNGIVEDIYDVIYFNDETFDNTKTEEMAIELDELNRKMIVQNRQYILIGPGRFGTQDKFLGIPVRWSQISNAKVIVEVGLKNFNIDASQGTHFFHNLMSMNVGYFTIPYNSEIDNLDFNWLTSQQNLVETTYFKQFQTKKPMTIKMDGRRGISVIYKES
ncbi:MAG: hypothetical protein HN952_06935 [Candidatus Cloacimonetes bacterium]|jgi:hypothetical protein|nr:hypothetical protein [Candidatus Cloacimonadota bacterium]MBT6994669.1 hypothetical protein [Candidatus Cloacimonadota bacterium]